jgi:inhibitor of KinA
MRSYHPYTIFPLGDSALTIDFGNIIDEEINKKVLHLFYLIRQQQVPYIIDLVPAYSSLTVYYDLQKVYNPTQTAFEMLAALISNLTGQDSKQAARPARRLEIPVCYEKKYALDIDELSARKNLLPEEVVAIHTSKTYRVYMLGFLPGFAYMGEVNEQIAMPRKTEPRTNVDPGSVGIAFTQTGIYPLGSPGGWHIIGRTPVRLFHKHNAMPVLFEPGDEVQFYSITEDEFKDYQKRNS